VRQQQPISGLGLANQSSTIPTPCRRACATAWSPHRRCKRILRTQQGELPCDSPPACARAATQRGATTIHVHDTAQRVSAAVVRGMNGQPPNGASYRPSISADGRYVA
jgi:hypothetical protein